MIIDGKGCLLASALLAAASFSIYCMGVVIAGWLG